MGNDSLDGTAGDAQDQCGLGNVQVVCFTHPLNVGCEDHKNFLEGLEIH